MPDDVDLHALICLAREARRAREAIADRDSAEYSRACWDYVSALDLARERLHKEITG